MSQSKSKESSLRGRARHVWDVLKVGSAGYGTSEKQSGEPWRPKERSGGTTSARRVTAKLQKQTHAPTHKHRGDSPPVMRGGVIAETDSRSSSRPASVRSDAGSSAHLGDRSRASSIRSNGSHAVGSPVAIPLRSSSTAFQAPTEPLPNIFRSGTHSEAGPRPERKRSSGIQPERAGTRHKGITAASRKMSSAKQHRRRDSDESEDSLDLLEPSESNGVVRIAGITRAFEKPSRLERYFKKLDVRVSDERTRRRLERAQTLLTNIVNWGHKLGIDTSDVIYRTGRMLPVGGTYVASAAGALNWALVALKDLRLNGSLCNLLLEDTIYDIDTCWNVLVNGTERNEEALKQLAPYMQRIIDHCQNVVRKTEELKHSSFLHRFLFREDIKRQIDILGKRAPFHIRQLDYFTTVRNLTILIEAKAERRTNHKEVMAGIVDIQKGVQGLHSRLDRLGSDGAIKIMDLKDSGTQTSNSWEEYLAHMPSNIEDAIKDVESFDKDKRNKLDNTAKELTQVQRVEEDKDALLYEIAEVEKALKSNAEITEILGMKRGDGVRDVIGPVMEDLKAQKGKMLEEKAKMKAPEPSSSNDGGIVLHELEKTILDKRIQFAEKAIEELGRIVDTEGKQPARNPETSTATHDIPLPKLVHNGSVSSKKSVDSSTSRTNPAPRNDRGFTKPTDRRTSLDSRTEDHNGSDGDLHRNRGRIRIDTHDVGTRSRRESRHSWIEGDIDSGRRVGASPQTEMQKDVKFFAKNLHHGYDRSLREPLWTPSVVNLGDVGYVSKLDGSFKKLFSALNPPRSVGVKSLKDVNVDVTNMRMSGSLLLRSGRSIVKQERAIGAINEKIKRAPKMTNHTGDEAAFMYLEKTRIITFKDLRRPKKWFKDNRKRILDVYGEELGGSNLILVTGKLEARDYALLIDRNKTNKQIRFYVFRDREKGRKWGKFALAHPNSIYKKNTNKRETEELVGSSTNVSKVQSRLDFTMHSVLLARLRFDDRGEPISE